MDKELKIVMLTYIDKIRQFLRRSEELFRLMSWMDKKINKIQGGIGSFFWFVAKLIFWVVILAWLTPLLASFFVQPFNLKNLTNNDFILFISTALIVAYTYETQRMRNEMVKQTELQKMPILIMYIRRLSGVSDLERRRTLGDKYAITEEKDVHGIIPSNYYPAIRNVGGGPALNVEIRAADFKATNQTNFFAPNDDEHAFKIVRRPNNKIRSINELKQQIFTIKCQSIHGKNYTYRYKINDVAECNVEFIA